MALIAKAYQRLERHAESLEQLEAALEAMHLKNLDKAIFYSTESLKRKPNDFVLMGNHAMNLLIAEKDTDALNTIEDAIRIQPNDSVNQNIQTIVKDVIAGSRKRPCFEETIQ